MGLCKCPKRQVTNQFCFEHRVNVCEHCMVQSHPKCIVQSYLQWLRDSDYVANCNLCGSSLDQEDCVRLICYHVFHWKCLDSRQTGLPPNTTPRGHQCPSCDTEIFPTSNLISPVAEKLKTYLSSTNWGRTGLGLTLLPDEKLRDATKLRDVTQVADMGPSAADSPQDSNNSMINTRDIFETNKLPHSSPHSVLLMDSFSTTSGTDSYSASSRRPLLPRQSSIGSTDRDENKYRRRTPTEIVTRWTRRLYAPTSRPPWRRTWFIITSGVLLFILFIYLISTLSRGGDDDTFDDGWNNPNPNPHYD